MSEFQYYEFLAIDRPLTADEMRALRAITSRATITPTSLINSYEWGDFKGQPSKLMERYFDAFLYFANWGTHEIMLRLPQQALDPRTAAQYCRTNGARARATRGTNSGFVVLEFRSENDSGDDWEDEPEGWLASIVPVRGQLAAGDHRALYLGWLACVQQEELPGRALEPPVPAGLGKLTAALAAFADFLRLDRALITAAAERSAPLTPAPSRRGLRHALDRWIRTLPPAERDDLLARLLTGAEPSLAVELQRGAARDVQQEVRRAADESGHALPSTPRTVAELLRAVGGRT